MSEQNASENTSSHIPGIAIIALIAGLLIYKDAAFEPSRPAMTDAEKTSTEDVRSRLWQDPFEAVRLHMKKFGANSITVVAKGPNDDYNYQQSGESVQRICSTKDSSPEAHSHQELLCQVEKHTEADSADDGSLHVLTVMVPGGPYAEDREWRLRNRYAVVSGLVALGYKPENPEHIGFVDFSQACKNAFHPDKKDDIKSCDWPAYMPYEWFQLDSLAEESSISTPPKIKLAKRILVLWLDNDALARNKDPINMLGRLKYTVTPKGSDKKQPLNPSFNIIGPHSSGTLKTMYREMQEAAQKCTTKKIKQDESCSSHNYYHLRNSLIFSSTATIDSEKIKSILIQEVDRNPNKTLYESSLKWLNHKIIRTIAENKDVVDKIIDELQLRRINPPGSKVKKENACLPKPKLKPDSAEEQVESTKKSPCESKNNDQSSSDNKKNLEQKSQEGKQRNHIVLISEWDTVYSRSLIQSFNDRIDNKSEYIHEYKYLRGIDGINANEVEKNKDNKGEGRKFTEAPNNTQKELRRPEGSNQFDYLRRLADQLADLHQSKIKQGGIKAIGILGSDPYDKLLILQALHKKFPNVLFFMTDLDSRFLHPAELPWTRNLIVASPYGLTLDKKLQKSALPFRDAYQTSLYLATKLAIECRNTNKEIKCHNSTSENIINKFQNSGFPPRLFEIGNNRAIDLSPATNIPSQKEINAKAENWEKEILTILICLNLLLIIVFLLYLYNDKTRKIINQHKYLLSIIGLTSVIIFPIAQGYLFPSGLLQSEGVSNTDTVINIHPESDLMSGEVPWGKITSFLIVLNLASIFLLHLVPAKMRKYIAVVSLGLFSVILLFIALLLLEYQFHGTMSFADGTSTWPANAIRLFAIVVTALFIIHLGPQLKESNKLIQKDFLFLSSPNMAVDKKIFPSPFFIGLWNIKNTTQNANTLWNNYLQMRKKTQCVRRVAFMFLLYFFCIIFAHQIGYFYFPELPIRGGIDYYTTRGILTSLVVLYLLLIFIIADITHLSSRFINLLITNEINWPPCKIDQYCKQFGLPENVTKQKLLMDFVNQLAGTVNSFIFYPFIILFLIILSRSHYFDNWHYTPLLFIIIGFTAAIALLNAIRLRNMAVKARKYIVEKLDKNYRDSIINKEEDSSIRIKLLTAEIKNLNSGPFLPLSQHPIVLSVLLPIGSIGSLYLIEYLASTAG